MKGNSNGPYLGVKRIFGPVARWGLVGVSVEGTLHLSSQGGSTGGRGQSVFGPSVSCDRTRSPVQEGSSGTVSIT